MRKIYIILIVWIVLILPLNLYDVIATNYTLTGFSTSPVFIQGKSTLFNLTFGYVPITTIQQPQNNVVLAGGGSAGILGRSENVNLSVLGQQYPIQSDSTFIKVLAALIILYILTKYPRR